MKKTAMQLLIEQLESMKLTHPNNSFFDKGIHEGIRCAIREANQSLETEREQIEEAYVSGDLDYDKVAMPKTRAKQYYKDTYQ